jgi:hypothetical protein
MTGAKMRLEVIDMSETLNPEVVADDVTSSEEAVNQMFAEMKRANEKMTRDQEEIERLKAETNEILARLKAA